MAWFEKKAAPTKIPGAKALWTVCGSCRKYIPNAEWKANGAVCPECGYHGRISSKERIALLADEGSFEELFADVGYSDHLSFRDASGAYVDKVEAAKKKTGEGESVTVGRATLDKIPVVLGAMDFAFMGGSLGTGTGEKIARAAEVALAERKPFILASASGGARMQEGIRSLMQMGKTSAAIRRLKDAGLPFISILTDPTTGGVSASYAMLGDLDIAEPKVLIGFAGRRVIENTIHQKLPPDFQTAEYLLAHGFVDKIVPRTELKAFLAKVLRYFDGSDLKDAISQDFNLAADSANPVKSGSLAAMDVVKKARAADRLHLSDYAKLICDDFTELHGDRLCNDDRALVCALATIGGVKCLAVGHNKGATVEENIAANFGMASPDGYRKAMRLMTLAEKFHLPVVTFVDTPGAYPGKEAEERGQAEAIAKSLEFLSGLKTPVLVIVTGEGGSGGALAIAIGDRILMLENSIYSVISPEGCAGILWRDGSKAAEAAEALKITAPDLDELGVIDGIIPEGASREETAANVKRAIVATLKHLKSIPTDELVAARYAKFRAM